MNATQPVTLHMRCSLLSHTYDDKRHLAIPWEKVFAVYNNHLVRKAKQSTRGTSWLNHSLVAAVAMVETKKLFIDRQKREADHFVSETAGCFVYDRDKKTG
ncbi:MULTISPECIES: hypothetical protein [Pantoea]|jgi:hypothetical protein|uniref:hypothetical protein n=1 Tax=Pantoea TaxID=53335 RepID=UPI001F22E8E4|nr:MULTISPECIES: hypothetical protein [Pantoea]UIL52772.1 hypothetical protein LZU96_02040 [Pantoea agglomerans]